MNLAFIIISANSIGDYHAIRKDLILVYRLKLALGTLGVAGTSRAHTRGA